jgi:hypothetical protein
VLLADALALATLAVGASSRTPGGPRIAGYARQLVSSGRSGEGSR